jgi:hypothetical protein
MLDLVSINNDIGIDNIILALLIEILYVLIIPFTPLLYKVRGSN